MKYPYIGKCEENELTVIFSDNGSGTTIDEGKSDVAINGKFECGFNEREFKNITAEYLVNTYGEVKSKEHAESIVKLCENAGIDTESMNSYRVGSQFFNIYKEGDVTYLAFWDKESVCVTEGEKQITIPLPPKCESVDEWPKVGSKVTWGNCSHTAEVIAIHNNMAWLFTEGEYHTEIAVSKLQKPKTPEQELAEKLIEKYKHLGKKEQAFAIAKDIIQNAIDKYNITKKPQ